MHRDSDIKRYWDRDNVESIYDKNFARAEADLIVPLIPPGSKVLDAGCGEGEGTLRYASVPNVEICACDYSETRLTKARKRLSDFPNVSFEEVDFNTDSWTLDRDFDRVITQRFLINIPRLQEQLDVIRRLVGLLNPAGKLLMMEGSQEGADALNELRAAFDLEPILIKWHNRYFNESTLIDALKREGFVLEKQDGLGAYFLLTRGLRPFFEQNLDWDCDFNRIASSAKVRDLLNLGARLSRVKLWVFGRA